jgi:hypothetical protein
MTWRIIFAPILFLKQILTVTYVFNPLTASCENAMTLSVPGVPASCDKFPHSSQLNFWSTESIFNPFSVFLKTLNALCVCLQYKHTSSMKRVIRSDKPITLLLLLWSHKCDIGAESRSRIIVTSAVKGLWLPGDKKWPLKAVYSNRSSEKEVQRQVGRIEQVPVKTSLLHLYVEIVWP